MHAWIYNHKLFGPFLTNWTDKKVFPQRLKFVMLWMMMLSLGIMWASNVRPIGLIYTAGMMLLVAVWAWRYPSSVDEYNFRKDQGKRIGWFK